MKTPCKLPVLGENIDSAEVANILVSVGDRVDKGQDLIEVETGKAAMPVPSPASGTVAEISVKAGSSLAVGEVYMLIESADGGKEAADGGVKEAEADTGDQEPKPAAPDPDKASAPEPSKASKPSKESLKSPAAIDFTLPDLGEGISEADVGAVLVANGDQVEAGQGIIEVETGKASVPVPAPAAGTVQDLSLSQGDRIAVGARICRIIPGEMATAQAAPEKADDEETASPASPRTVPAAAARPAAEGDGSPIRAVPASPSVRRFAREIGLEITEVQGSGAKGRISLEDVKAFAKQRNRGAGSAGGGVAAAHRPLPDFSAFGSTKREKMSGIRKATAEHMQFCNQQVPQVTQFDKADITALEEERQDFQKRVEAAGGGKLTVTAVLVKVCAVALKKFPELNASIDMPGRSIVFKDYVNIGIAVDTPRGLVVPVIRDAAQKNIIQITSDLGAISGKARAGKLSAEDMQGGTFTISNLGGIGGTGFTPIVNWPEVAILGVARGEQEAVWNGESFQPRLRLPLSLSYDHRLVDGALAARFLRWICEALEHPLLVQLEG